MNSRSERLLKSMYEPFDADWSEPFHDAWMGHADKSRMIRLAHGIAAQWLGSRMIVEPDELIVGHIVRKSIVNWSFTNAVSFDRNLWNERYDQAGPSEREYLEEMRQIWPGKTGGEIVRSVVAPEERAVCSVQSCIAPGCHASPIT